MMYSNILFSANISYNSNVSEHSILPSDATAATSAVKLKSGEPSTILSKEDGKGGHSPRNVPEVVSDEIQKETEKPLVEDRDEFEEAVESSTASVVVPELSVAMAIRILKSLLPIVENNALFASVKDVYAPAAVNTNTNTLELSAAVKLIEQVMVEVDRSSGESSDGSDEKKSAAAAGHSNSSIGYAVRLIVQSKAAALIPMYVRLYMLSFFYYSSSLYVLYVLVEVILMYRPDVFVSVVERSQVSSRLTS